ncbi:MAG: formyltransferase family protein [Bdellovibrionota bacterium]
MRIAFLFSEYVLHNHIIERYHSLRPENELLVIKVPLTLRAKSRMESASSVLPKLSRRFIVAKLVEHLGLLTLTYCPKVMRRGAVFRRLSWISRNVGAKYIESTDINSQDTIAALQAFSPDVIITLMHQIVRKPLLAVPRLGVINIHPGLLPDFRGIQPYFWSLSEGAAEHGCTLHLIEDESIDTGGVLAQHRFSLSNVRSVQLSYYLTALGAAQLLPEVLDKFSRGELTASSQATDSGSYYRWPDSAAYQRLWERRASLFRISDIWGILSGRYDSSLPTSTPGKRDAVL